MNMLLLTLLIAYGNFFTLQNEVRFLDKFENTRFSPKANESVGELLGRVEKKIGTSILVSEMAKRSGVLEKQYVSRDDIPPVSIASLLATAFEDTDFKCIVKDGKIAVVRNHRSLSYSKLHDTWGINNSHLRRIPELARNIMNRDEWKNRGGNYYIHLVDGKILAHCNESIHEQVDLLITLIGMVPLEVGEKK